MSNSLAIATVSGVLVARVRTLLTNAGLAGFDVRATHPTEPDKAGVYLHLYQVLPNAGLRNETLPDRSADGIPRVPPRLALDLHYLLTFVGDDASFDAERLAGLVMTGLNEVPLLGPTEIKDFLAALPAGHVLARADLGDQLEHVRFTLLSLDLEDVTRLWGTFGRDFHRVAVAYRASTVLLDAEVDFGTPLPVTTPAVTIFPLRQPEITAVESSARRLAVVAFGEDIVVRGRQLRGGSTLLRLGAATVAVADARDEEIVLKFDAGSGLAAGMVALEVVHQVVLDDGTTRDAASSNTVPVALVPSVSMIHPGPVPAVIDGNAVEEVWLAVEPLPSTDHDVQLILVGTAGEPARTATAWRIDTGAVVVLASPLTAGTYLVRVSIDRAVSLLETDPATGAFTGPALVVP